MKTLIVTGARYTRVDVLSAFVNKVVSGFKQIDSHVQPLNQMLLQQMEPGKDNQLYSEISDKLTSETQQLVEQNSSAEGVSWSDEDIFPLLNFWKTVVEQPVFILSFCSPEYCLSQYLSNGGSYECSGEIIQNWKKSMRSMLDFFQKNRSFCILVNVEAVESQTQQCMDAIKNTGISLTENSLKDAGFIIDQIDPVIALIASVAVIQNDELLDIYEEAESAATVAHIKKSRLLGLNVPTEEMLIKAGEKYQSNIREELELNKQLTIAHKKLNECSVANDLSGKETKESKNRIESLKKEIESSDEKVKISNIENKQFLEKLIDKEAELELAVLQLQQASEELGQVSCTAKEGNEKIKQLEKNLEEKNEELKLSLLLVDNMQDELEEKIKSGSFNSANIVDLPLLRLIRAAR